MTVKNLTTIALDAKIKNHGSVLVVEASDGGEVMLQTATAAKLGDAVGMVHHDRPLEFLLDRLGVSVSSKNLDEYGDASLTTWTLPRGLSDALIHDLMYDAYGTTCQHAHDCCGRMYADAIVIERGAVEGEYHTGDRVTQVWRRNV